MTKGGIKESMAINCPVDGTVLEGRKISSIEIQECPQCGGLWFDQDELRRVKDQTDPDLKWLDFDLWSDHEAFEVEWSGRKCPVCGLNLAAISYAGTGVVVDYCTDRHGVWLDRGELQAIIEALEKEVATKDVPDYIAASLREARDIVAGDAGFASEWKDFLTVTRLLQYRVLAENPKVAELIVALQATNPLR